jgi:hypothetical protein
MTWRRVRRVRRVDWWFFYLGDWVVVDWSYAEVGVGRFVGRVVVS